MSIFPKINRYWLHSLNGSVALRESVNEIDGWIRFVLLVGSIVISALVLYGTLSHDIAELHTEVDRFRAEIRCLAEPDDCDVARLLSEMKSRR